jgi:hypothetical protein
MDYIPLFGHIIPCCVLHMCCTAGRGVYNIIHTVYATKNRGKMMNIRIHSLILVIPLPIPLPLPPPISSSSCIPPPLCHSHVYPISHFPTSPFINTTTHPPPGHVISLPISLLSTVPVSHFPPPSPKLVSPPLSA